MASRRAMLLASATAEEMDALIYSDFETFCRVMFAVVYPGKALVWASYLSVVCAKLAQVAHGDERRLIITLPPRHLKSFIASAALPAYILGRYPEQEIMCISYAQELSRDFARQTAMIMQSEIYRHIFGDVLKASRPPLHLLRTAHGGARRATSLDGTATGVGGDILIFDDPQKPGEALSETIRRATNATYENTFASRGNDPKSVRKVIVMQRLHEDDFVSHVMELGEDWKLINFPAIAEDAETIDYDSFFGPATFSRKAGEALHPKRVPLEQLAEYRKALGEMQFATQFLQRPAPAGGGVIKIAWLRPYDYALKPNFDRIVQSWDTASSVNERSAYSVCTTWGVKGKDYFLLDVYRERLTFPDLLKQVKHRQKLYSAQVVLIEDHSSGTAIIQQLRSEGLGFCRAVKPTGDKETRMENQTALMEAGRVFIPTTAPWLETYLHELALFPNCKYFDQIDSTSQALDYLQSGGGAEGWIQWMRECAEENQARLRGEI